jgi:hypothetical protein
VAPKRAIRVLEVLVKKALREWVFLQFLVYAMSRFVVRNHNIYQTNNAIHHTCTRQFVNLHVSSVRLSLIQRGVMYSLIKTM